MAAKTFGTSETISRPTQVQDRQYICHFLLQTVAKLQWFSKKHIKLEEKTGNLIEHTQI